MGVEYSMWYSKTAQILGKAVLRLAFLLAKMYGGAEVSIGMHFVASRLRNQETSPWGMPIKNALLLVT